VVSKLNDFHLNLISLRMATVFVRVLELRTDESHSRLNKLILFAETSSSKKPLRETVRGDSFLKCDGFWKFEIPSQSNETLNIVLKKRHIFSRNKTLGRCVLPTTWFPTNRVVREWYPMIEESEPQGSDSSTMILLDVHIDTKRAKKFKAMFSNLRVIPTWQRPVDEFAECPAPPQVIYVIQDQLQPQGPAQPPRFVPVGCAQHGSPQMIQPPPHANGMAFAPAPPPCQYAGGWNYGVSIVGSQNSIAYPTVSIRNTSDFDADVPPVYV
jgi:hypothetical protein